MAIPQLHIYTLYSRGTITQFIISVNILYTAADFDFDGTLTHTFEPVANIRQTTTFDIDIVNDDRNERVEDFVAVVTVTHVAHQFDSHQTSPNLRSFTTITILIDPNAPDSESMHHTCDQLDYGSCIILFHSLYLLPLHFMQEHNSELVHKLMK